MLNTVFTALALLFIIAMVLQIFTIQAFFMTLKKRHKSLYEEMGSPRWRIQLADDGFRNGLKYIRSKAFEELHDAELESIYKKLKRIDHAAIGFGLIAAMIIIYQAILLS